MPKVISTETLAAVTADLAANRQKTLIAKRHNIGRQWLYDWESKLQYHGIDDCADVSDELLQAIYVGDVYTPPLTSEKPGWHYKFQRRKRRKGDS